LVVMWFEDGGLGRGWKAAQERPGDRAVQVEEQSDCAGKGQLEGAAAG
jgi:hypothetical protein